MPDDILREIFLSCIEEDVDKINVPSSLDPRGSPWCLAKVSSRWRAVALSFPRLWSTIRITVASTADAQDVKASLRRETHLAIQLHRSASYRLLVCLRLSIDDSDDKSAIPHSLLRTLVSTSPRWRFLSLNIPLAAVGANSSIKGFLQSLTTLRLQIFATQSAERVLNSHLHDLFQFAPLLHTIISTPRLPCVCLLPRLQISEYKTIVERVSGSTECFAYPVSEHLDLLKILPNLERGIIMGPSKKYTAAGSPHIQCNRLRTLIISDTTGQLLQHLTLPVLESLTISCTFASLRSFCSRSPGLQRLRVMSSIFTDDQCSDLLDLLPSLQNLILNSPQVITMVLVGKLASRTSLASALTSIVFQRPLHSTQEYEAAVDALRVVRPRLCITSREVGLYELY